MIRSLPVLVERKGRRIDASLPSRIVFAGTREAEAVIANISFYGFRATCAVPFERGDFVSVALPHTGLVRAKVAWSRAGSFGAMFLKPVDIRTFMRHAQRT